MICVKQKKSLILRQKSRVEKALSKRDTYILVSLNEKNHEFLSLKQACSSLGFNYKSLMGKEFPFHDSGWKFEKLERTPNDSKEFYEKQSQENKSEIRLQRITQSVYNDLRNIKTVTGVSIRKFIKDSLPSMIENHYKEFPTHRPGEG